MAAREALSSVGFNLPGEGTRVVDRLIQDYLRLSHQAERYRLSREAWRRQIGATLDEVGFTGLVSGSWSRSEFHLDVDGHSMSDLDLVLIDCSEKRRIYWIRLLEDKLAETGIRLPVSVHPEASFAGMSREDRSFFSLMELLIWHRSHRDYALAKACIMLSRERNNESAVESGVKRGMTDAVAVKLGLAKHLEDGNAANYLSTVHVRSETLGSWIEGERASLEEVLRYFTGRFSSTGAWIFSHGVNKCRSTIEAL